MYVDKTAFIRQLEADRYVFLVRPRRFGKTLWLTMLDAYYDRAQADDFERVFAGTDIGGAPTAGHSSYMVLYFDFSAVQQAAGRLAENFEQHCTNHLRDAMRRNSDLFDANATREILSPPSVNEKLDTLFLHLRTCGVPLYVLIDEYDNFANNILVRDGANAYEEVTGGGGFYRDFFAAIKAGTGHSGSVERLFVTGVSPITMDDLTSGFNIGTNVSLRPELNAMLGFTEEEVQHLVQLYHELGLLAEEPAAALATMRTWYNGYRFSAGAAGDVYNTDMVLYYLHESIPNRGPPQALIDDNVRIDYGKLRHLLLVDRQSSASTEAGRAEPNGNFEQLRTLVADGWADGSIRRSFPLRLLAERESFLSLLHYFGLLSIRGVVDGTPRLGIPNEAIRQVLLGYLRDVYNDSGLFVANAQVLERLLRDMAYRGVWAPVLDHLAHAIERQTSIRDYIAGEKVLHGFLAAYLGISDHFLLHSKPELNKGFADLCLLPNLAGHPQMRYGYVIELKYLKVGERKRVRATLQQAKAQLARYLADAPLRQRLGNAQLIGIALVFRGPALVAREAVTLPA